MAKNIEVDWLVPGVPRIKRSTGSRMPSVKDAMNRMKKELLQDPEKDWTYVFQAIYDRKTSLLGVYRLYQKKRLHTLDVSDSGKPYSPTVYEWLDNHYATKGTKKNYRGGFKGMEKLATGRTTLRTIPALLKKYRIVCEKNGQPTAFRHAKTGSTALLKSVTGNGSELHRAALSIPLLPEKGEGKSTTIPPTQLKTLLDGLTDEARAMALFMCCTGIESNIYWSNPQKYEKLDDITIAIHGEKLRKKSNYRDRIVPVMYTMTPATIPERRFQKMLQAIIPDFQKRDFRAIFDDYCGESGISYPHVVSYMGHTQPMTLRYSAKVLRHEHLTKDAKLFRNYFEREVYGKEPEPPTLADLSLEVRALVQKLVEDGLRHAAQRSV